MIDTMIQASLDAMEQALRANSEAPFKAQWHAGGYAKNLVGTRGLAGEEVFSQGSRKKWFLKPDLTRALVLIDGAAVIVPCEIWAWVKGQAVDKVKMLFVKTGDGSAYVALGGGENAAEVEALANRFLRKEPLEPPTEAP